MLLALKRFPEPLCIETCDTTFPDCVAFNPVTEERVKIEFEYRSSAFLEHKHEWLSLRDNGPKVRWMIVCWDNDLGSKAESLRGVEIVELKRFSLDPTLVRNPLPSDLRSEKMTQTRFDWRVASIPPHQRGPHVAAALARLRNFGANNDLGFTILWPRSDDSVKFSIVCQRHGGIRFGASAKGTIGIPFSKWHLVGDDVKARVIEKLKAACRTWISPATLGGRRATMSRCCCPMNVRSRNFWKCGETWSSNSTGVASSDRDTPPCEESPSSIQ